MLYLTGKEKVIALKDTNSPFGQRHPEGWRFLKFNIGVLVTSALDILSYLFFLYFVFRGSKDIPLPDNAVWALLGIRYRGYLLSYLLSTSIGYIAAYLINRHITFHSDVNPAYSSSLYLILAVCNILISSYIGSVFGTYMEIHHLSNPVTEAVVKFVIINIPTLWTYPLERYVIQTSRSRPSIKYIASDLDGTLLASNTEVSKDNLAAIERLSENGIKTILLTGRTFYEIPAELRETPGVEYSIFSDGAGIFNRKDGVIRYTYLPDKTAKAIFRILSEYQTFIEVYSKGIPFVESSKFSLEQFRYYGIDRGFIPEMFKSRHTTPSLAALVENAAYKTELFDVFFKEPEERDACRKRLCRLFRNLSITSSLPNNLEICAPAVSKGSALKALCRKRGIDIRSIVVVGDSQNDITSFETRAKKYVVANACEEIKTRADKTICSNDENIMCYLEKELA